MINVWGITDVGAVRKKNEDRYYIAQYGSQTVASVVCDGMGGARAGHIASQTAIEVYSDYMKVLEGGQSLNPLELLRESAKAANHAVFTKATQCEEFRGMGTTMVAALVQDNMAYVLNVGDSRGYHIFPGGIYRITTDHSLVEVLLANGKITKEEATNHPQKNLITRALGSTSTVEADIYQQPLLAGEYLLLCSDGLSNMVTEQEILYEIIHGGSIEHCCQRLLDICMSRGARDNVTIVLLEMKEGGL